MDDNIESSINNETFYYMRIFTKSLIFVLVISLFVGFSGTALAYNPTMSVYSSGSGDTTISISGGQSNSSVVINYTPSGSSLPVNITGLTDFSGNFTTMVSSANSSQITATVGGQQVYSNGYNGGYNGGGCGIYGCSAGGFTLSQTSLSLNVGQSASVTANLPYPVSGYGSGIYIGSNSNNSAATASASGNQVTVYGASTGSANISICANSSGSACVTLFVTVSGGSSCGYSGCGYNNLTLSQNTLTLTAGQSGTVTVNNNFGAASYLSSNSNSSVAGASVSGNSIYVNAISSGTTNISICQNSANQCVTLYVTVSGGSSSGSVTFSPSTVNLSYGQSSTVYITAAYYGTSLYISNNSSPSVVSASLTGSTLYLQAGSIGASTITVCQSSSICGSLYVNVGGGSGYGGNLSLNQTSLNLNQGQSMIVSASNVPAMYVSSNSNPGVVSVSISGAQATFYGQTYGSSTVILCGVSSSQCANVYVTVGGGYSYGGGGLQYSGGGNVLGANTYPNGRLISEGSTVYIVYKNTKTAFSNSSAFLGLGFRFGNVLSVGNSGLAASGYIVSTSIGQHPWGSWIKSGNTVYFIHDSGLIPLPNWTTFINNGGQANLIVPANTYDFRLPMLSVMTAGDSRLR